VFLPVWQSVKPKIVLSNRTD